MHFSSGSNGKQAAIV